MDATSLAVPPPKTSSRGDGILTLYSYPHKEMAIIPYRRTNGTYDPDALKRLAHAMRSPDGGAAPIAPTLVELLDAIQDHFRADTVEIISGFRSPGYNAGLRAEGRNVAKESLHMKGLAADIHLDEITEAAVRDFALALGVGGVGYYPSLHFVHVDVGPVRQWAEKEGPRKLVGLEANQGPCTVVTDRNVYRVADRPEFTMTVGGAPDACGTVAVIHAEHFSRGRWEGLSPSWSALTKKVPRPCPEGTCTDYLVTIPSTPFGKYRLHVISIAPRAIPSRSNEFYWKQQ